MGTTAGASWPQLASAMTDPMDNKQKDINNENSF